MTCPHCGGPAKPWGRPRYRCTECRQTFTAGAALQQPTGQPREVLHVEIPVELRRTMGKVARAAGVSLAYLASELLRKGLAGFGLEVSGKVD